MNRNTHKSKKSPELNPNRTLRIMKKKTSILEFKVADVKQLDEFLDSDI